MNCLNYLSYIVFALAPSVIWLLFYLSKDPHPEPKRAILKVFFLGILSAGIVYIFSLLVFKSIFMFFPDLLFDNIWFVAFRYLIIVALVEELAKYLIVRNFIMSSGEIDEPTDVMLYLMVSALGFAALENLLLIFNTTSNLDIMTVLDVTFLRFIGATFLHVLASGTLGFFLAMSFCYSKKRKMIFFVGLFIAVIAHGFYNFVVLEFSRQQYILMHALILSGLAILTGWGIIKLRNLKAICKI